MRAPARNYGRKPAKRNRPGLVACKPRKSTMCRYAAIDGLPLMIGDQFCLPLVLLSDCRTFCCSFSLGDEGRCWNLRRRMLRASVHAGIRSRWYRGHWNSVMPTRKRTEEVPSMNARTITPKFLMKALQLTVVSVPRVGESQFEFKRRSIQKLRQSLVGQCLSQSPSPWPRAGPGSIQLRWQFAMLFELASKVIILWVTTRKRTFENCIYRARMAVERR